jgi:tetratricopeptide (TPR) repeat protein
MKQVSQKKYFSPSILSLWKSCLILAFTLLVLWSEFTLLVFAKDSGIPENLVMAVNYFQNGHYEKALKAFESVIRRDPNTPEALEALFYSAECLYALENWADAVEKYRNFHQRSKKEDRIDRLVPHFAEALVKTGGLSEAIQVYERWLDEYKDTTEAKKIKKRLRELHHKLAEDLIKQKKYHQAKDVLKMLLKEAKNKKINHILQKELAECLFFLQLWPEAINAYEEIRKEDPNDPLIAQVNYWIMLARFAQKEWGPALQDADRFLITTPKSPLLPKVIYLKAWSLYKCGQYKKAVDFLLRQPEYKSVPGLQNINPWIRAEEAMLNWDYDKSITIFREIIDDQQCDPNGNTYWLAHLRLAACLWRSWKFREAHKIYRLIEKGHADEDLKICALLEEGEAYLNKGWFIKAHETFSFISRLNHDGQYGEKIMFLTAQSLCHVKRWKEAQDLFHSLTIKYPNSAYLEETEWRLAEASYKQCDFQKAVKLLDGFIQNYPNSFFSGKALYMLGWSYIYLEELSNAEKIFKGLLKAYPEGDFSAQTHFALGRIHFKKGKYDSASDLFFNTTFQAKNKDLIQEAKFFISLRHFYLKNYSQARKGFEEILEEKIDTENNNVFLFLGWTFQSEGKYKEASSTFKKYLEANPISFYSEVRLPLIWRLAKNAYLLGDYQGTWHWIDLILCEANMSPYHKPAHALKLQCLLDSKDYKGYLEMSPPFLDHNPRVDPNHSPDFAKVNTLIKKGELRSAAGLYEDLSIEYATFPGEIEALFGLGMTQKAQGLYKSALRTYAHAIDRCKEDIDRLKIHQAMGEILFKEKAYGFAARHFEKAFSIQAPEDLKSKTSLFLGLINRIQGQKEIALQRFREFFVGDTLDNMSVSEKIDLGLFLEDVSEYALAIKVFQKVLESKTDKKKKAEAQFWIGECYQKMGDLEKAVQEYLLVVQLYPDAGIWGITARFKSAEIYQKTGNLEKALALYRKVQKLGTGESYGRFATKRINEIKELVKKKKKGGMI